MDVLEMADRLWRGEESTTDHHPVSGFGDLVEVDDDTSFVRNLANAIAFRTGDGLVMVDTGSPFTGRMIHDQVRDWAGADKDNRLHTAVYSHGHIDHVFGVGFFEDDADENGWPAPRVVAHEALPDRFDRYVLTAGYNGIINARQFSAKGLDWPTEYRYPDETYRSVLRLDIGGEPFELHHARGETDDHTWTWVPGRRILCTGDLFIWACPNGGNPQKVQRYPREWAVALREMTRLEPEMLLPGHGWPVIGADRVQEALGDTAEYLESIVEQSLALMNDGARLDDLLHTVTPPAHLAGKPYLQPVYDEPEFIVRNIWRLYGGWYDGNPANLKPAPERTLAAELADLVGGVDRLAARAVEVADAGDLRLAGHLAELAVLADDESTTAHAARADVFERRASAEPSTMATGVFRWAADESKGHAHAHPHSH